jgi:nucleotide-binding universal stress UspA family protein
MVTFGPLGVRREGGYWSCKEPSEVSMERDPQRTIVVGVDGSDGARRALDWAIEIAKATGQRLELVHGIDVGVAASSPYGSGMVFEQLEEAGRSLLEADVDYVRAAGLEVTGQLDLGSSAQAILTAAKHASMLVLGSRGHGGFAGLMMGSVSMYCVHHAHCPVVVVPPPER